MSSANAAAAQQLANRAASGGPLDALLQQFEFQEAQELLNLIMSELAAGINPRQMARDIGGLMDDITYGRAETIARTETLTSWNDAALENYRANSDVVNSWMWVCMPGAGTCVSCLEEDGTIYGLDEELDDHPNGRCCKGPVTNDYGSILDSYGIDTTGLEWDAAPWENRETGAQWLLRQDAETQRRAFGSNAAYNAWKSGDVPLKDFVGHRHDPVWGDSIYQKSLRSMGLDARNYSAGSMAERAAREAEAKAAAAREAERVRAQRALEEAQARWEAVRGNLPEHPVYVSDSGAPGAVPSKVMSFSDYAEQRRALLELWDAQALHDAALGVEERALEEPAATEAAALAVTAERAQIGSALLDRTAADLSGEAVNADHLLDQANITERDEESKARISQSLADALQDSPHWQALVTTLGSADGADAASTLLERWALGGSVHEEGQALYAALQMAVRDEFHLADALAIPAHDAALAEQYYGSVADGLRAYMREMYDQTQAWLKDNDLSEMLLYRGQSWSPGAEPKGFLWDGEAHRVTFELQPLSSFTVDGWQGYSFGGGEYTDFERYQMLMASRVEAKDILSTAWTGFGAKGEAEVTVLGKPLAAVGFTQHVTVDGSRFMDGANVYRKFADAALAAAERGTAAAEEVAIIETAAERAVTVTADDAARTSLTNLVGRDLSDQEIADLVGARAADSLTAYTVGDHVQLRLMGESTSLADGSPGYSAMRSLSRDPTTGDLVMANASFNVAPELQGHGIGIEVFSEEATNLSHLGIDRITTAAVGRGLGYGGEGGYLGYYTWARFGYDGEVPWQRMFDAGLDSAVVPENLRDLTTIQEIMHAEGGLAFWKQWGIEWSGTFDLAPDSESMRVLREYQDAKTAQLEATAVGEAARTLDVGASEAAAGLREITLPQHIELVYWDDASRNAMVEVFGRPLSAGETAALVGAQDDAAVIVRGLRQHTFSLTFDYPKESRAIEIEAYDNAKRYEMARQIVVLPDGTRVMVNANIDIPRAIQGQGLGTKLFSDEVRALRANGFDRIDSPLEREGLRNGYYTWARLGYDGAIPLEKLAELGRNLPAEWSDYTRVSDLMATPEGRAWWKVNGTGFTGSFDLTSGSYSMRTLDSYLESKGMAPIEAEVAAREAEDAAARELAMSSESRFIAEKDVAAWTADNAAGVPDVAYHYTAREGGGAESLRSEGVQLERSKDALYTVGFYMLDAPMEGGALYGSEEVRLAVHMEHPLQVTETKYNELEAAFRKEHPELSTKAEPGMTSEWGYPISEMKRAFTERLLDEGYDGVIISQSSTSAFHDIVIAIKPGTVRVLRDEDAAAIARDVEKQAAREADIRAANEARYAAENAAEEAKAAQLATTAEDLAKGAKEAGALAREVTPLEAGPLGEHLMVTEESRHAAERYAWEHTGNRQLMDSLMTGITSDKAGHTYFLAKLYGEPQLGAALSARTVADLRERTLAFDLPIRDAEGRLLSKSDLVSSIVSHVTEGRYTADFAAEGARVAEGVVKGTAERVVQERAAKEVAAETAATPEQAALHEQAARLQEQGDLLREVTPQVAGKLGENLTTTEESRAAAQRYAWEHTGSNRQLMDSLMTGITSDQAGHTYYLAHLYGEDQLGAALNARTLANLRERAQQLGIEMRGTKAELVSRITSFVTEGRYSADFSVAAREVGAGDVLALKEGEAGAGAAGNAGADALTARIDRIPADATVPDIQDWLQQKIPGLSEALAGRVELMNLDAQTARLIANASANLIPELPAVANNLYRIQALNAPTEALAYASQNGLSLIINTDKWLDLAGLAERTPDYFAQGWWVAQTPEQIIGHEIGHLVQVNYKIDNATWVDAMLRVEAAGGNPYVSQYAKDKVEESFAETFALLVYGEPTEAQLAIAREMADLLRGNGIDYNTLRAAVGESPLDYVPAARGTTALVEPLPGSTTRSDLSILTPPPKGEAEALRQEAIARDLDAQAAQAHAEWLAIASDSEYTWISPEANAKAVEEHQFQRQAEAARAKADYARGEINATVHIDAQRQEVADRLFGRDMSMDDLKLLSGAQRGDQVYFASSPAGKVLKVITQGSGRYNEFRVRSVRGELIMHHDLLRISGDASGVTSGASILRGLADLRDLGVARIETLAAQGDTFNGYYTWARLGFQGDIPMWRLTQSLRADLQAQFPGVTRVEQLMALRGGPQWWKAYGVSWDATLDLNSGAGAALLDRLFGDITGGDMP